MALNKGLTLKKGWDKVNYVSFVEIGQSQTRKSNHWSIYTCREGNCQKEAVGVILRRQKRNKSTK